MKKLLLTSMVILLTIAGSLSSCNKKENGENGENEEKEPGKVPFTEFSLSEATCVLRWITLHNSELFIINSDEELQRVISCVNESDFPIIDFTRYTLLFVSGMERGYLVFPDNKDVQRLSRRNYVMNVTLQPYAVFLERHWWYSAIIISKLEEGSNVELNIIRNEKGEAVNVPFTKLATGHTRPTATSGWISLREYFPFRTVLSIINSNEELLNYFIYTEDYALPVIDFSKYTLLLARGTSGSVVRHDHSNLQQLSPQNYVMSIVFRQQASPAITYWYVAIITKKIEKNDNVKLIHNLPN